jgi:hypothetical protein
MGVELKASGAEDGLNPFLWDEAWDTIEDPGAEQRVRRAFGCLKG